MPALRDAAAGNIENSNYLGGAGVVVVGAGVVGAGVAVSGVGAGADVEVVDVVVSVLSLLSDGRRFSFGRSLSSPVFFFDGSVSSSIGAVEFGLRRKVGLLGSSEVLSGRR